MAELEQDFDRKILFVEGQSDLTVWRHIIPDVERQNMVVYPIAVINIDVNQGGERGRLLACAGIFMAAGFNERVHFFADADFDRVLQRPVLDNVTLTDGRDVESYLFLAGGFEKLCLSVAEPEICARNLQEFVVKNGREVGVMRLFSEINNYYLPFNKTIGDGRLAKFVDRNTYELDAGGLLRSLLQNCAIGLSNLISDKASLDDLLSQKAGVPDHDVVHGKDLSCLISMYMKWDINAFPAIFSLFFYSSISSIRVLPNVAKVQAWMKG